MKTEISIVIPTYSRPKLLCRCLDALCLQSLSPSMYEIIVVTDGPDAYTRQVVEEWAVSRPPELHFQLIETGRHAGPAAARNTGWQAALGELVVFTDDDCIPTIYFAEDYYRSWQQVSRPGPAALKGRIHVPLPPSPTDHQMNIANLATAEFVTANCALPRQVLAEVKGFDTNFKMAWREDSDLHFKLKERSIPVVCVEGATVVHPVRDGGWGISLREQKKGLYNALLYKKYPSLYRKHIAPRPLWNYYGMVLLLPLAVILLLAGDPTAGALSLSVYAALLLSFLGKRLKNTSRAPDHIFEMAATSVIIPFLSIYWTIYGSFKFKVWFL